MNFLVLVISGVIGLKLEMLVSCAGGLESMKSSVCCSDSGTFPIISNFAIFGFLILFEIWVLRGFFFLDSASFRARVLYPELRAGILFRFTFKYSGFSF